MRQPGDHRNSKKRQWIVYTEWRSTALPNRESPGPARGYHATIARQGSGPVRDIVLPPDPPVTWFRRKLGTGENDVKKCLAACR